MRWLCFLIQEPYVGEIEYKALPTIPHDANVNAEDENGQTALHAATAQGYVNIAKMLLKAGADAYSEDLDGDTAFHFADRNHHFDLLELLENCT